jgi:hypothetical protein
MPIIIPFPVREAHPDRDAEARKRMDRLNRATIEEMQAALASAKADGSSSAPVLQRGPKP